VPRAEDESATACFESPRDQIGAQLESHSLPGQRACHPAPATPRCAGVERGRPQRSLALGKRSYQVRRFIGGCPLQTFDVKLQVAPGEIAEFVTAESREQSEPDRLRVESARWRSPPNYQSLGTKEEKRA
jgi:hypothetical protein